MPLKSKQLIAAAQPLPSQLCALAGDIFTASKHSPRRIDTAFIQPATFGQNVTFLLRLRPDISIAVQQAIGASFAQLYDVKYRLKIDSDV